MTPASGSRWLAPGLALTVMGSILCVAVTALTWGWASGHEAEAMARPGAVVLLEPGTDAATAQVLSRELAVWPELSRVEVKTGEENLAMLRVQGSDPGVVAADVPASLSLYFLDPGVGIEAARPRLEGLEGVGGVVGVEVSRPEVVASVGALAPVRVGALAIGAIALLVGVWLVSALQGASLSGRREEIVVMRLLGGTERQVVWPLYRDALGMGAVGGSAAALALALLEIQAAGLGATWLDGGVVVGGAFLGGLVLAGLGTWLGVVRHLRPMEGVA